MLRVIMLSVWMLSVVAPLYKLYLSLSLNAILGSKVFARSKRSTLLL